MSEKAIKAIRMFSRECPTSCYGTEYEIGLFGVTKIEKVMITECGEPTERYRYDIYKGQPPVLYSSVYKVDEEVFI